MYSLIRKLLFRIEAEAAHEWTTDQIIALQQIPIAMRAIAALCKPPASASRQLFGLTFPSPIGIAAGFDKNGVMMPMLAALGFGFIEVGTVTPKPQAGNPRPRLFRYPAERALINRMGFNNDGADAVAERLKRWRSNGARVSSPAPPVFVNVGKNRDTSLDAAADDYTTCYIKLAPHADAAVLNLSSPNTPGLRDLQKPEQLEHLLRNVRSVKAGPVLVKIAPDLTTTQLSEIAEVCKSNADGMICTNTTMDRLPGMNEAGGLSGAPLMQKSTAMLQHVRNHVGADYALIGVGGVFTAEDVRKKIAGGANLVQLYTSLIYQGPGLPSRLSRAG
jgi:dihydroorotate dehydrogenase